MSKGVKMPPTSGSEVSQGNNNDQEINIEAVGDDVKACNNAMTTIVQLFQERLQISISLFWPYIISLNSLPDASRWGNHTI